MATIGYFRNADNLHKFSAGEVILNEGDQDEEMFVVIDGEIEI